MGLDQVLGGRIIKHVITKTYEIALYELRNGSFVVGVETLGTIFRSDPINDLNMANFMFERRQQSLEGH